MVWLVSHLKATWPPNANLTQLRSGVYPRATDAEYFYLTR